MTNKITEIIIPEITSAVIADRCRDDAAFAKDLKNNPIASLESKLDVALQDSGIDIRVAQNTDETVHVALPHYENMEEIAGQMTDEEMAGVSGGEIFVTALVIGGIVAGGVVAAAALGGIGYGLYSVAQTVINANNSDGVVTGDDTI